MNKDPERRLGVNGGVKEILDHPFFSKINLNQLKNKKIPPPLKPDPMRMNLDENESVKGE